MTTENKLRVTENRKLNNIKSDKKIKIKTDSQIFIFCSQIIFARITIIYYNLLFLNYFAHHCTLKYNILKKTFAEITAK